MRKLFLFILLVLFFLKGFSQVPTGFPTGTYSSKWYEYYQYLQSDSGFFNARRDTGFTPRQAGCQVYYQGQIYFFDGTKWNTSGNGDTTIVNNLTIENKLDLPRKDTSAVTNPTLGITIVIEPNDENLYLYSIDGYWKCMSCGNNNWQQTLDNGSKLNKDNAIDGGGKYLQFFNNNQWSISSSGSALSAASYAGLLTLSSTYRTKITADTLQVSANTNNSKFIWNYGNLNIYDNSTNLNISIGQNAGDTLGIRNIFIGNKAGRRATGSYNVLLSTNAGQLTSQDGHVAIGRVADQFSNYGFNTSVGYQANSYGIKGWNTVIGANANSADVKYSTNLNTSVIVTSSSTISGATVATYITNAGLSVGDTSAYKVTFNGTIPLPYTDVTNPFKGVVTASNTITFLSTDNFTTTGSGTMTVSVYNKYDSTVVLGLDAMPTHSHQFALSPYIDTLYLAGVSSGTNYVLADVNGSKKFIPKDINSLVSQYWAANGNDIYNTNSGNVGIGTTTPAGLFEVYGGTANNVLDFTANSSGYSSFEFSSRDYSGDDFGRAAFAANPESGVYFSTESADLSQQAQLNISQGGASMSMSVTGGGSYTLNTSGNTFVGNIINAPSTYSTGGYDILVHNQSTNHFEKVSTTSFPYWGLSGNSGTTAVAAQNNNRNYVICEINPEYIEIIKNRLTPPYKTVSRVTN